MEHNQRTWLIVGLAAGLAACSGSGDGSDGGSASAGTGTISVALMDAPVDGVTNVFVEIESIWMKPAGDGPPFELALEDAPVTVDLLALTDENAAVLVDGAVVPAGEYEWLAMDVNAEHDGSFASYAVATDGTHHQVRVPSGRVRLVGGFEVGPNDAVRFLFDWDVRRGLVDPPGLPGYLLKPAFRVLEVGQFGVITGSVSASLIANDPDCIVGATTIDDGNLVYVFDGDGVPPQDLGEAEGDAITTAMLTQDGTPDYVFRAVVPSPGTYTVVWTCQGEIDNPEVAGDDVEFWPADGEEPVIVTLPTAEGSATAVVDFL